MNIDIKQENEEKAFVPIESEAYIQAHNQLKIGAFKPVPYFTIYLSDLSPKLIRELHSLDCRDPSYAKEDLSYKELAFAVEPADSLVMYASNGHFPQITTMTGW